MKPDKINTLRERHLVRERNYNIKVGKEAIHDATMSRIPDLIEAIEKSFELEAEIFYNRIIDAWQRAREHVREAHTKSPNGLSYHVMVMFFGLPEKEPVFVQKYLDDKWTFNPAYDVYHNERQIYDSIVDDFKKSYEGILIGKGLWIEKAEKNFDNYVEQYAVQVVAATKQKLWHSITNKLSQFQTLTLKAKRFVDVRFHAFQGNFDIDTEQGPILFSCEDIRAEGPIQRAHYRFLSKVKFVKS